MAKYSHRIIAFILISCCLRILAQAPFIQDPTFTPAFGQLESTGFRAGEVVDFGFQSNGKIVVGGHFTKLEGRPVQNIARLNRNGSLDTKFVAGVNDRIQCMILDRQDRIIIGGRFTAVNGEPVKFLARLLPDGGRDQTFNPVLGINSFPAGLLLQDDGKILVYGLFLRPDGPDFTTPIFRLNDDGTLDRTFQQIAHLGGTQNSRGGALQPDGKILLGGSFSFEPNITLNYNLIRLNQDGTIDPTFLRSENLDFLEDIEIQADGRILVMNLATIIRLQSSGEPDPSFKPLNPYFSGNAIFVQADGTVAYSVFDYLGVASSVGSIIGQMQLEPYPTRFVVDTFHTGPDGHLWVSGGCNYNATNTYGLLRLLPSPVEFYSTWRQKYTFIAGTERMGPLESGLQDGIPNFVKYALGLSPMQNIQTFEPPLRITADGELRLRYNTAATDVIIRLEKSSALSGAAWRSFASWHGDPSSWLLDGGLSAEQTPTEVVITGFLPPGSTQFIRATFLYDP